MRVLRLFGWMALALWVAVVLTTYGSARAEAFAREVARGKIWVSPVWPEDKIVRDYLVVKFRSTETGKTAFRAWGLKVPDAALPPGWNAISTQEAARAFGLNLQMEKGKPSLESLKALALRLAEDPRVEMVVFDYQVFEIPPKDVLKPTKLEGGPTPLATPNDPLYFAQWHFTPTTPKRGANAEGAWDITDGDPAIRVAIIDTGVTEGPLDGFQHPFVFECNTAAPVGPGVTCGPGSQGDWHGHGTHVAGTVAQETAFPPASDDGLAGIATDISLMAIQTFATGSGVATGTDIAEAITVAAQNGADVINMSLGADCGTLTWEDGCSIPPVDAAIDDAVNNYDVVIVAAAGNAAETVVGTPANHPLVIAVAATDQDSLAYYSTYGAGLSLSAPGGNFLEDVDGDSIADLIYQETHDGASPPNWGFYGYQGTSMASPHVAGAAALLRSHNPAANWRQVRYCLESTAVDGAFGDPAGYDAVYGWGLLDIEAALNCIASPPPLPTQPNAHSTTASLGGISVTTPQNTTVDVVAHLSETQGADLTWSLFFSENNDCSTTDTISWLSLDPGQAASGTLTGYGATSIDLDIDPSTTPLGTYTAYLCISSNDPDPGPGNNTGLIPVPITVTIEASLPAPDELACNAPAVTFENGIPSTWTVVDNEGTGVVWDVTGSGTCAGDSNYTNGSGKAACVNSDAVGTVEFDTELRTNAITIPASATSATLRYTANYQNYNNRDFLDLDISTDGGVTWTTLLSWNEDHPVGSLYSPPGEDVVVDLSPYIGQTIILRWHYYDPNSGDWDWYAQIDDVALDCPGAPSLQPNIDVNPLSLSSTQDADTTTTQPLTIANTGNGDLAWSTGEEDQGFTPLTEKPRAEQVGRRFRLSAEDRLRMNIQPQGDPSLIFTPGLASAPVTLDGQISPGEWDDAAVMNISTGAVPVLLYAKYDVGSNTLYLAVDDQWDPSLTTTGTPDQIIVDFDDEGGTAPILFDDQWTNTTCPGSEQGEGTYWWGAAGLNTYDPVISGPTYCGENHAASTTVAVSDAAGNVQYEVAIPLSGTTALQAAADTFFGFEIVVIDGSGPYLDGAWPILSDFTDPGTFGNIHLATQCVSLSDVGWLSLNPAGGTVAPGGSTNVTVTFDSTGLAPGTYQANLCIYSNDPDLPTGDNGTGLVVVPVTLNVKGADLELTKTVDNATPLLGQNVTFTITVTETKGVYDATGVEVTDLLPAGLTYVSHTASQGTYDPGTGVWNVGTIPAGGSATLDIVAQVAVTGAITNEAEVTAVNEADPDSTPGDGMGDDYASVTLNASPAADLSVDKTVDDATPLLGQNVTFTVTVNNGGPSDATGVEVTDLLPAGLTYVSHTASQGTYDPGTGVWNVGTIPVGGSATLDIVAQVAVTGAITNEAEVTAVNEADPDSTPGDGMGDDYASVTVNASPAADLELRMTASNDRPAPGEVITVTVDVRNVTPAVDAPNVLVKAFFGDGFEYVSHTASQGTVTVTISSVDIDWDVGTIPAGGNVTLTVQLKALETPSDWQAWAEVEDMGIVDRDSVPGDRRGDDYGTLDIRIALPPTGFPAGRVTVLPPKPEGLEFARTGLVLEIPRLGLEVPIVGVPSASWEAVAWLGNQVGYIQSTTFPTWRGNSVLTAHNYLPTGMPGPFVDLDALRWGDVVRIHYLGTVYEYQVRRVTRVDATDLWPFKYPGAGTWVTLITCTGEYDEASRLYSDRVVVQAVLMRTYAER